MADATDIMIDYNILIRTGLMESNNVLLEIEFRLMKPYDLFIGGIVLKYERITLLSMYEENMFWA